MAASVGNENQSVPNVGSGMNERREEMEERQERGIECGKFKVELRGVGKRVVVIPVHITLEEVHEVVQALFGWEHDHMWEFKDEAGRRYGDDLGPGWKTMKRETPDLIPAAEVCLSDVLPERGGKLRYEYDFGDGWCHVITRMADPKEPGRYCVQTEGPDGIEDIGGVWGLMHSKRKWHVPGVAEITKRLERVSLKPQAAATGLLKKEDEVLDASIRGLTDQEWEWLGELGSQGVVHVGRQNKRFLKLLQIMPGVRYLEMPSMLFGDCAYRGELEFRRLWRKKREEWERLRGEPASPAPMPQSVLYHKTVKKTAKIGRNDPCPCGSGKKYKKCCGKNA